MEISNIVEALSGDNTLVVKVVVFLVVQALVYFILSNSSDVFSRNKMRSFSFKPARSVSIRRILAVISDLPAGGELSPRVASSRSLWRAESSLSEHPSSDDLLSS